MLKCPLKSQNGKTHVCINYRSAVTAIVVEFFVLGPSIFFFFFFFFVF